MNDPILTIGIPTYNRPINIVETIKSLLPQLNEKVRLVVYDNCSDRPVSELFSDEEKSSFTIVRNKANIGGDANIAGVIYNAETKWVWDLGDDDIPTNNAISTILEQIEKHPEALMFNFNTYKEGVTTNFAELAEICKYRYMFSNLLFISSGIYNREKLSDDILHYYLNITSMIGQAIFVLKHLERQDDTIYFIKDKIVQHSIDGIEAEKGKEVRPLLRERPRWSREVFVKKSSVIFDLFSSKRKMLNGTLFKGIALEYLKIVLDPKEASMTFWQRIKLFKYVSNIVGFYNILKYNSAVLGQYFIKYIVPDSTYKRIKKKAKLKYVHDNA